MTKLLFIPYLLAFMSCGFIGVTPKIGNGISTSTVIEAGKFDAISSHCSIDVIYTQTEGKQSVTLTCDSNLVEFYDIRVDGSTLVIDTKRGTSISSRTKTFVTVNSPMLSGVKVSGSGDVQSAGNLETEGDFSIKVSGSGEIEAEGMVTCSNLFCNVSGSGDIDFSMVQAESAGFKVSGSGSIEVGRLTAEAVSVKISGSGDVELACHNAGDIDATINGSGNLYLSGNARSLKSNTNGSGRINSRKLKL